MSDIFDDNLIEFSQIQISVMLTHVQTFFSGVVEIDYKANGRKGSGS